MLVDLIVFTFPLVTYSVTAELINSEPNEGSSFIFDVNLNVLVPVLNLNDEVDLIMDF